MIRFVFRLILFSSNNYDLNLLLKEYNPSFILNQMFNLTDFSNLIDTPEKLISSIKLNEESFSNSTIPSNQIVNA